MLGKKRWEESQIKWWKEDKDSITKFFKRFNLDISDIYDHVLNLGYGQMQIIVYLLSKIEKAIKICDYLDRLEKEDHDDVDVVKIYLLISHAEIAINNFSWTGSKIEMVEKYFQPVTNKHGLNYKVRLTLNHIEKLGNMSFAKIFYKIRCDYTHEGNYTGKIFRTNKDKPHCYNVFGFNINGEYIVGECNLVYNEFLNIFMSALIENIKIFSNYKV